MKLLFDLLPVLLFFGAVKFADAHKPWAADFASGELGFIVSGGPVGPAEAPVVLATVVVIAATLAQVLWLKLRGHRVHAMLWGSLMLVMVLGGSTDHFHSETLIKWKPSMLYWGMGLAFWLSPLIFGRNLLRLLMGEQLQLPARLWHRLNFAWVAFFAAMGLINLWVAHHVSADVWVDIKLFGGVGLILLFMLGQGWVLSRYLSHETGTPTDSR